MNQKSLKDTSEKLTHLGINILLGFSQTQIPPATWDLLANIHKLWIVLAVDSDTGNNKTIFYEDQKSYFKQLSRKKHGQLQPRFVQVDNYDLLFVVNNNAPGTKHLCQVMKGGEFSIIKVL